MVQLSCWPQISLSEKVKSWSVSLALFSKTRYCQNMEEREKRMGMGKMQWKKKGN